MQRLFRFYTSLLSKSADSGYCIKHGLRKQGRSRFPSGFVM
uniref:Uncharacterized protein n=1 Tax=Utricularia reniformis TaxID=192314 RepID=A0A1Y0B1E1_9LAMI|nr:hypothetical protein AEK19_MT1038 [Utricularia reniformis]ART31262.1 hypothetical protein AEK19_MT1038 [Utricularia reniformis]